MRELERIDRILENIKNIWLINHDLRFGQLLINIGIAPDDLELWAMEDNELEDILKLRIKLNKQKIGGKK